jgi:hypothetical protein
MGYYEMQPQPVSSIHADAVYRVNAAWQQSGGAIVSSEHQDQADAIALLIAGVEEMTYAPGAKGLSTDLTLACLVRGFHHAHISRGVIESAPTLDRAFVDTFSCLFLEFSLLSLLNTPPLAGSNMSPRLTSDLLTYQFNANGMVGAAYSWRGEYNRAIKHYAMAVLAAKKLAESSISNSEDQKLPMINGEWQYIVQFKLALLPLMAQLYAKDRDIKNPVKHRVVKHADAGADANVEDTTEKLEFGIKIQPHHEQALSKIQAISPSSEKVDWIAAKDLTSEIFKEEYLKLNRPLIMGKGLIESWPANQKWTSFDLIAQHGTKQFKVGNGPQPSDYGLTLSQEEKEDVAHFEDWLKEQEEQGFTYDHAEGVMVRNHGEPDEERLKLEPGAPPGYKTTTTVNRKGTIDMTLTQFMDEVMRGEERAEPEIRYIFNTLVKDKLRDDFTIPDVIHKVTPTPSLAGEDWTTNPGVFEFSIGPAGSGSHPHVHAGAWNALVHGRKRWILWAPSVLKEHAVNVSMPALEFFTEILPKMSERSEQLYEFIQEAGEIVYIPDHWGHAVLNLEPSVGASRQLPYWKYSSDLSWIADDVKEITEDWTTILKLYSEAGVGTNAHTEL